MMEVNGLQKAFGKNQVLKGIDLSIKPGKITAILGPNASGKTTLIKSMLGLVVPDKGTLKWNGNPINAKKDFVYRQDIGYISQIARFPENLKVRELIRMLNDMRGDIGNPELLNERFGLNQAMDTKLGNLSGGTRQKVNIVTSLMFDSPFMILDEPTVGLDPVALISLKDLIHEEKQNGKTILLTTHIMNVVEELADEIVFLLEGHVYFQGTLAEMKELQHEENLERAIARILLNNGYEAEKQSLGTESTVTQDEDKEAYQ